VERDAEARTLLTAASLPDSQVPALFFPDGSSLVQPGMADLAQKVGLQVHAKNPFYDVVIIGGGPAGLSAAVYASFDGLKVLVVERQAPGGQAGNSPKIENYIGFPSGISGGELTRRAVAQARRFGTEFISTQSVQKVRVEGVTKIITLSDGSEISAKMVLVATGKWFRTLTLPGVERWNGAGVYYGAAHTEAANYKNQEIFVIGAGNAAAQGIIFLAKYARKVSVLIRSGKTDWSRHLNLAIQALENVELCYHSELLEIHGADNKIQEIVVLNNSTQENHTYPAAALFVFIGQKPQSEFLQGLVELTPGGNILTGLDLMKDGKPPAGWPLERDPFMLETSVPGIFAAGDVRNGVKHGVAAAVGDGGAAVSLFWQYLSTI
jgi:thioredoxin reductase (NADPH)